MSKEPRGTCSPSNHGIARKSMNYRAVAIARVIHGRAELWLSGRHCSPYSPFNSRFVSLESDKVIGRGQNGRERTLSITLRRGMHAVSQRTQRRARTRLYPISGYAKPLAKLYRSLIRAGRKCFSAIRCDVRAGRERPSEDRHVRGWIKPWWLNVSGCRTNRKPASTSATTRRPRDTLGSSSLFRWREGTPSARTTSRR